MSIATASYLLHCFIISLLFGEMLERRFPTQMNDFLFNISYNCIYYYGKLQLLYIKYISNSVIFKAIYDIAFKSKSSRNKLDILFVKNNFHYNTHVDCPDLIIVTDTSKNPKLKRISYEKTYNDISFDESSVKFILAEFIIGNPDGINHQIYKIDLKTNDYNYYMVGNKFTKNFCIYYINEHLLSKYNQHENDKNEMYSLRIMDSNIKVITIKFTDNNEYIELYKNDYKTVYC